MSSPKATGSEDTAATAEPGLVLERLLFRLGSLKLILETLDFVLEPADRVLDSRIGSGGVCAGVEFYLNVHGQQTDK